MTLRKLFTLGIILAMFLVVPAAVHAEGIVIQWNLYSDPGADNLILESSVGDQSSWSEIEATIATTATVQAVAPPTTIPAKGVRVWYKMFAENTSSGEKSDPSNVVSYLWKSDGTGQIGLQSPGGVGFLDCTASGLTTEETNACAAATGM